MENNNIQFVPIDSEEKDRVSFNFSDFVHKCIKNWYWFALSLFVCVLLAGVYILRTRPVFQSYATVLIKEASARRMATSDIESVINFSGGSMSSKVVNEVIAFKSPALMAKVVERLDLNTEYSVRKLLRSDVIYGSQVPVNVEFLDMPENYSAKMVITKESDTTFSLSKLKYVKKKDVIKCPEVFTASFGDTLSTEIGHIVVNVNPLYVDEWDKWEKPVQVSRCGVMAAAMSFLSSFKAEQTDVKNKSDVITLTLVNASSQRARDILNMLITVYNENWVEDKNRMAVSTTDFIDTRLISLERELRSVDDNISEYKSSNLIPETSRVAEMTMQESYETASLTRELQNKIYIYRYLKSFLQDNPGTDKIIPLVASFSNHGVGEQIMEYNKMLLQRDNLRDNSSDVNPRVVAMSQSLISMRAGIDYAVDSQLESLETQLVELKALETATIDKIAQSPSQVQYLTTIGRQQKVKETLYLYLLQKREENELSQAFTAYNTRIITPPMTKGGKVAPKSLMILFAAFFFGFFAPLFVLYFIYAFDDKVRSKADVEKLSMPFLGEVPQYFKSKKGVVSLFSKDVDAKDVLVKEGSRDIINESFRILRTNLEFMTRGAKCPVISVISFQPGSGKTFMSMNTSAVLSIKKKKILVIDGDMRHASLSEFVNSPRRGLSTYLSGAEDDFHQLIVKYKNRGTLDVLPTGSIPPNPSELISSPLFVSLLEKAREEYDYIIIDCPPLEVVADTQIIQELVDRTVFVVRAGLIEKSMLPKLEKLYTDKTLKNLSLVLNGTSSFSGYYGVHSSYYGDSKN